jgi:hypothetical protein
MNPINSINRNVSGSVMRRVILKFPLYRPQGTLYLRGGSRVSYNFPSLAKRGRGDFLKYVFSIMDSLEIGHDSQN